jgi:hypothetical protein
MLVMKGASMSVKSGFARRVRAVAVAASIFGLLGASLVAAAAGIVGGAIFIQRGPAAPVPERPAI